jgi:hypothetical protein
MANRTYRISRAAISLFLLILFISTTAEAKIIYVDDDANGLNDGTCWNDAYNYLQNALAVAQYGDEIRVGQGIYKPDQGIGITRGDRTATFQLKNGVVIKGGYAGFGEPDPNDRDTNKYITILSGDLLDNDVVGFSDFSIGWNSYHVVTSRDCNEITVLDGFTITGGNDDRMNPRYEPIGYGGGMFNDTSSPMVSNCAFTGNYASNSGGGMYNWESSPTLTNCMFIGNSAGGWIAAGGAIFNYKSSPEVTNCKFIGNSARVWGGAICNYILSTPTLSKCIFSGNSAHNGGGMSNLLDCTLTLTNCIFTGNSAVGEYADGGGLFNKQSGLRLTNCTFSGNKADGNGRAMAGYWNAIQTLTNCILCDGGDEIWSDDGSTITITYSDVESGWPGEGNIDADPCFVDPGYWDSNGVWVEGNYHLLPDSPCINTGDPNHPYDPNETDLDDKPRIIGGRIDMGAFEYSPPISAEVRIVARTFNLASKGKWIACYILLPEDYDVADIDPNSILLENEIEPERFWINEEQQVAMARFSRSEVQLVLNIGEVELTITGKLTDGTLFEARDNIKVIDKGGRKPPK